MNGSWQPALFPEGDGPQQVKAQRDRRGLDREAALELYAFAVARLRDRRAPARADSVEEEVSQLKQLIRRSARMGGPATLTGLSLMPDLAARLFTEPGPVSRPYVFRLWDSFRAFVECTAQPQDEAARRIAAIEERLIPRRPAGWYKTDRVAGGRPSAGRDRYVLFATDLLTISVKASDGKRGERALRDEALVRLVCWSGLRLDEVAPLDWEHMDVDPQPEAKLFPAAIRCSRRGEAVILPVHANSWTALARLRALAEQSTDRIADGAVFRTLTRPHGRLSSREARLIVEEALAKAGFAGVSPYDLRAAFADYLQTAHGFTDLELTSVLGYAQHQSSRMLLEAHHAVRLNERVRALESRRQSAGLRDSCGGET